MTTRTRGVVGASVLSLALGLGWSTAAHADQPAALFEDGAELLAQARELWAEGTAAFNRGQLERARLLYLSAFRAQHHWQIAGSLGHVEMALGRYRDAAEHLTVYLRESRDLANVDPRDRALLTQEIERARAKVGAVAVIAEPAGAEVLVDGAPVGKAPLADPVFVEPGRHVIEARMDGYKAAAEAREMAPGGAAEVRFKLVAEPKPEVRLVPLAPKPSAAPRPVRKDWRTSYLPAGAAFGIGALGIGVGAITGAVSLTKVSEIRTRCLPLCDPADRGEQSTARTLGNVSTGAFVIGGLGAVTGAVFLGLRRQMLARPDHGRTATWSVDVGHDHIELRGSF